MYQRIKNISLCVLMIGLFITSVKAQDKKQFLDTIEISTDKNSYIKIEGIEIKHLDMGGDENVLFVAEQGVIKMKAITKNFPETNFLVIGANGVLVQFLIRYNPSPKTFLYTYNLNQKETPVLAALETSVPTPIEARPIESNPVKVNEEKFTEGNKKITTPEPAKVIKANKNISPVKGVVGSFEQMLSKKPNTNIGLVQNGVKIRVTNLAVDKEHLYFAITITNNTKIEYEIDYLNFEVRSKSKIKETSEQSVYPEFITYQKNPSVIGTMQTVKLIYALDKFYLRNDEVLTVSVFEKASASKGRQYILNVFARDFNQIEVIN